MNLTYEEQQLLSLYNSGGGRGAMIAALSEMREYLTDAEADVRELTDSALTKLRAMSDADFEALDLIPDFSEEPNGE